MQLSIIASAMMLVIPQEIRSKVMSITMTCSLGIQPIGTLLGGILGDVFNPRIIIILCFVICIIGTIPIFFSKSAKKLLNYNPKIHTLDDIKA